MTQSSSMSIRIMPYSMIVGQTELKLALELAYVAPRLEGVLLSGQRGTAKSTAVRAFSMMVYERLPVTLPINATEDRVVGSLDIDELLKGHKVLQTGLLHEAAGTILYIDEVNLLDDHLVNIILDVTSTGKLIVEREHLHINEDLRFTLIGTMNPSEGGLRPQLLDRFSLMVNVVAETNEERRTDILESVLHYDAAILLEDSGQDGEPVEQLRQARAKDQRRKKELDAAKAFFPKVVLPREMAALCVKVGNRFQIEGHRGDYVMGLAARARAALRGVAVVEPGDLIEVAPMALQHRREGAVESGGSIWSLEDTERMHKLVRDETQSVGPASDVIGEEEGVPTR
ncbi:MAG TPA: AAA family ATPase [Herpetosiphonaceae bacterium]|nr:AAA family ATPase [Herpetosiphonaceae bacterium]